MEEYNKNLDAIDQMKQRPLSIVTVGIVIINILVFVIVEITGSSTDTKYMLECGADYLPFVLFNHEYWRLFTSMFLHFGLEHLASNMLLLFFMGDILERNLGKVKYFMVYCLGGIFGNIISCVWGWIKIDVGVSAGASGAVFAIIGGLIVLLIKNKGVLENLTIKKMILMAVLSLYVGFQNTGVDNAAHLGGFFAGMLLTAILYRKRNDS